MACLDMYNSEHSKAHHHHNHHNHNHNHNHHHHHHHNFGPVSPRISFSNDFADSQQAIKQEIRSSRSEAPVSSDFEFSVSTTNCSMMSGADELFFKGRLLPFKETTTSSSQRTTTTLRDELLVEDDDDGDVTLQPPKARWKSLLGLKKAHIGSSSKKAEKGGSSSSSSDSGTGSASSLEGRRFSGLVLHENEAHVTMTSSQDLLNINEGGSTCQDVEIGI
ncbi:membrane-associated kinase regulator-like protein [Trema orientale]|uniref:Membrane-associated kinase regulator-like protein n=1 Tax=Trema orientale TaxID=63057 RepID=A0A2P5FYB7_TREOI|nr:membrane-associated kinase regulator-like protein [Trema orientale]